MSHLSLPDQPASRPLDAPRIERQIALVSRQGPARSPQVAECVEWLRQQMGEAFGQAG
ncbi:hypothetical protein OL229_15920 [Neisseriaceae bacterium JH1-16]|nr:hypothetical protein [Neisseriaceae bacterium JH1-16]